MGDVSVHVQGKHDGGVPEAGRLQPRRPWNLLPPETLSQVVWDPRYSFITLILFYLFCVCGCFIFGGFTAQLKRNSSPGTLYGSISTVRLMERSVWTWAAALDLDFRPGCGSFSPFDRAQVTYCFELQCLPLYSSENASASVHYVVAEKGKSLQDRVKRKLSRHVRNSETKGSRPWTQSRVW